MAQLLHHKLDPSSRLVRLLATEYAVPLDLQEISHWKRPSELLALSPSGILPVFLEENFVPVVGPLALINLIEDRFAPENVAGLIQTDPSIRYEMWRMYEWVSDKFANEVVNYVLDEKIGKREKGEGTPDTSVLRVAKANMAEHMNYFNWLVASRSWLAGGQMSIADFALSAHLSSLDYLNEIDWNTYPQLKVWYARLKSRPSFRPLLLDHLVGTPPALHYTDLDF